MAAPITFRPDSEVERALARLTSDGTSISSAVRQAIVDAARRHTEDSRRAEAAALVTDPVDRAEAAQGLHQASLIYLGLVLFFITFVVLSLSKVLLSRLKKNEGGRT